MTQSAAVSAANLAEDLERWLERRPIIARRVSASMQIWCWSRRNPVFAGTVAASVALTLLNVVAAFTISHLFSMISQTRLAHQTIASVRFENLRELTPALNSIAATKNLVSVTNNRLDTELPDGEPKADALPENTPTDQ